MSTVTTPTDVMAPTRSSLTGWFAVASVMLGIFSIVTSEILPIGLLSPIGDTYAITDGTAGLMMTVPGILAAIAAPVVTVVTGRIDRHFVLCVLMLALALADFLAAIAPSYLVMMVSRVVVGIVIGAFWSIGAGVASRLVPAAQVGRATAVIFSAVPLGSALGVPAGSFIADLIGWRAAFVALGILTAAVFMALVALVPPLPPQRVTRLTVLSDMLRTTPVRVGLAVTFLIVMAHFGTYTYLTPFLADVTHAGPGVITVFLLVYGAAGIVGNFAAGASVTRSLPLTFITAAVMLAASTSLLPLFGKGYFGAVVLLIIWGLAYGAVPVCSQTWFVTSSPHSPEAASVLFTSSFQATISIGALAGGVVVDATSTSTVMVLGGVAAILMASTVLVFSVLPAQSRGVDPA